MSEGKVIFDGKELLDDMAYLEQRIIDLEAEVARLKSLLTCKENAIRCLQGD